ncbi:YajQ family cyclic di-GMP-binding protein [Pseudocolwellia agarivorans]|uniref:YajQ family cyclic di-GMP-binding protein n=1 Tax=Pseudocolwellia agarivorans TaxID=1911682 RepID=UPI000987D0EC|nr:YajQ family cyclic di-GMP-binding protein [Pseudocolwellia agarivorans]
MPSMDIVSEINMEEVLNATNNTKKELETRFDFRGVTASIEWKKPTVIIKAEAEMQLQQLVTMLRGNLAKRNIDAKALTVSKAEFSGKTVTQTLSFQEGIEQPVAKKVVKLIKDSKLKVQAAIQGEQVRVTGKKRDDLQQVMQLVREADLEQSFQFNNFRD